MVLAGFIASCTEDPVEPQAQPPPSVRVLSLNGSEHNVLAFAAHVNVSHAAAVAVEHSADSLAWNSTPLFAAVPDAMDIPVIGLRPSTVYRVRAVAISSTGARAYSDTLIVVTAALPAGLPDFAILTRNEPAPGVILLGINTVAPDDRACAIVIDNECRVVWYRKMPRGVFDFQLQPNGHFTAHALIGDPPRRFFEMDLLGNIVAEHSAIGFEETGPHELRMRADGNLLYGGDYRQMDLTAYGGLSTAMVRGIDFQRIAGGQVVFRWNSFDHFSVTDAAPNVSLTGQNVNPWHLNSIDVDTDGNYLLGFRHSEELVKVNAQTGGVMWRFGGRNNQFTILNDPLNGFSHQHGGRRLPNGNILIFDNGTNRQPQFSRAVEYRLDEPARVAELIWEYRHMPPLYANVQGFADRTGNGHTLVCYGPARRVVEVDMSGAVQLEFMITNPSHTIYRAFKVTSLQ